MGDGEVCWVWMTCRRRQRVFLEIDLDDEYDDTGIMVDVDGVDMLFCI